MAEGLIGTQQRTDSIREKDACEREHGGGTELKEYPVAEHIVCAIHVPLADADGIDRNASNADEHIHRPRALPFFVPLWYTGTMQ